MGSRGHGSQASKRVPRYVPNTALFVCYGTGFFALRPPACGAALHQSKRSGYTAKKISENVECEIMMVVMEEASESYR